MTPTEISSRLSQAEHSYRAAVSLVSELSDTYDEAKYAAADLEEVSQAVRNLAVQCQTRCQAQISSIVTRCLETIFADTKYTFKLIFEEKRGQTEARCVLLDHAGNEYDPLDGTGGGVMDVVTFGLRLACLVLQRPAAEKVLILDEPMRFLSKGYRTPMLALLEALASEMGIQFIIVTHFSEFQKGNIIEL